jgi:hypothetical protein
VELYTTRPVSCLLVVLLPALLYYLSHTTYVLPICLVMPTGCFMLFCIPTYGTLLCSVPSVCLPTHMTPTFSVPSHTTIHPIPILYLVLPGLLGLLGLEFAFQVLLLLSYPAWTMNAMLTVQPCYGSVSILLDVCVPYTKCILPVPAFTSCGFWTLLPYTCQSLVCKLCYSCYLWNWLPNFAL